ncbi:MAG: hypothetical protein ACKO5K_10010 [Armatimonadota bacterium]
MIAHVPLPANPRPRSRMTAKVVWAWTALLVSVLFLSPMSAVAVLRAWASDPLSPPPLARVVVASPAVPLPSAPRTAQTPRAVPPAALRTLRARRPSKGAPRPYRVERTDRLPVARAMRSVPSRAPPA